jgi:hypothetical protein
MFMPDKHIKMSESLLGLGGYLLSALEQPQTIDQLWARYRSDADNERSLLGHSFENLVMALDTLYAIGAIEASNNDFNDGVIRRCA